MSQVRNYRVNIEMSHMRLPKRKLIEEEQSGRRKNTGHPTSNTEHRSGSNSGFRCGFSIRGLLETVAVELDFSGKYLFHNLTLLRTKYQLIGCAIGSEVTLFSDPEVAFEGHVQARKNLCKFVDQIFVTNSSIDDNS